MLSDIISIIYEVIDACYDWFRSIYQSYGLLFSSLVLAVIFIGALSRFIIRPFIGGALQDSASKVRKKSKGA